MVFTPLDESGEETPDESTSEKVNKKPKRKRRRKKRRSSGQPSADTSPRQPPQRPPRPPSPSDDIVDDAQRQHTQSALDEHLEDLAALGIKPYAEAELEKLEKIAQAEEAALEAAEDADLESDEFDVDAIGGITFAWDDPPISPKKVAKAVSLAGLTDAEKSANFLAEGTARGLQCGGAAIEPKPTLIRCPNDEIFPVKSKSNAVIIVGKNRAGSCCSGYGGLGHTHAAEISLRAGLGGSDARSGVYANPTNQDAAFITISQKNDVDANLQFPSGRQPTSVARSSVSAVGDAIRFKAREGVKIWAGAGGRNSQGSEINKRSYGIDLIHGEGRDMQPLVKGANLMLFLMELVDRLDSLAGLMDAFLMSQFDFNRAVMTHTHIAPLVGPCSLDYGLVLTGVSVFLDQAVRVKGGHFRQYINRTLLRGLYLNPGGEKWICSLKNNTN